MKKFLSILLTTAIVLTLVAASIPALTVSALEYKAVPFFDCDSTDGFGFNIAPEVDTTEKTSGTASIKMTFGDTIFQRGFEQAIDASGCDSLEFDVYVADLDALKAMDGDGQIEIGSAKANDQNELAWMPVNVLKDQVKATGWNHIVLPFSGAGKTGGDIDLSSVNWFRWYWVGAANRLTINFDSFEFTNSQAYAAVEEALDAEKNAVGFLLNGCNTADGVSGVTVCEEAGYYKTGTGSWKISLGKLMIVTSNMAAVDISKYNRIEFDLYVTDAEALAALSTESEFEITSSGKSDENELHWYPSEFLSGAVDGWNHIVLNLDDGRETGGAIDKTAVNYIRWYWVNNDNGVDGYIDNIRLLTENDETLLTEEYEFVVFENSEQVYLKNATAGKVAEKRFADRDTEVVYMFQVEHPWAVREVTFTAKVGAQLLLQAGTDVDHLEDVYRWTTDAIDENTNGATFSVGLNAGTYSFDLTGVLDLSQKVDTVWIRIADAYPEINGSANGWGGNIYTGVPAKLVVTYAFGVEPPVDEQPGTEPAPETGTTIETDAASQGAETETSSEAATQGDSETPAKKGGCGSSFGIGAACVALAGILGACVVSRRKE